jgi:histidine phosphotransferase ChpT
MTFETRPLPAADLAALVGSRLCHDVVSPLGAIGNGVELLEMSSSFPGLGQSAEMQLIAEAVTAARLRIAAYRVAFGTSAGDQRISLSELRRLLEGLSGQGRLRVEVEADRDLPRHEGRMVLLGLMCLETALPWGGRVMAVRAEAGWRIVAECERSRQDPALWAWLDGSAPPRVPAPSEVQFPLLAEAAAHAGRPLRAELDDTGAEISF